jgi:hypothetical protein
MENSAYSYFTILLNDLEQAKNFLASYGNLLINFNALYGNETTEQLSQKMSEQEKNVLTEKIAYFRSYLVRTMISINSLKLGSKDKEKLKQIDTLYNSIKKNSVPKYDDCELIIQYINDLVVSEINVSGILNAKDKVRELG